MSNIFGWVGTIFIVGAYFLNSTKRIGSQSRVYQSMNLLGAIGVGYNVFVQHAWSALTLQVVWGVIALYTMLKTRT